MADVKALVDFTVEQTSVGVGDLLYVASAGTPAKVTYANLMDNNYTYSATMAVTGVLNISGGTLTFGGTENNVPKIDASGNLVDGYGVETTLTDDDTKLATSGGVHDLVQLKKAFESTGQTITSGGLLTLAHGLGTRPKFVSLELECTTGNLNYSVGDTIGVSVNGSDAITGRSNSYYYDDTNIYFRFSSASSCWTVGDKNTGNGSGIVNNRWELIVRAWA